MALCWWPCFTLDSTPALSSSLQWENVLELRTNKQNVLTLIHMIQGGQWPLLSWYMAHSSYVVNMENWYHCCQGIFNSSLASKVLLCHVQSSFFVPIKTRFSLSLTKLLDVLSSWSWWHLTRVSRAPMSSPAVGSGHCCYWYTMVTAAWWWPRWPCNNRLQLLGGYLVILT